MNIGGTTAEYDKSNKSSYQFEAAGLAESIEINGIKIRILNAYSIQRDDGSDRHYFEISTENTTQKDIYSRYYTSDFQVEDKDRYIFSPLYYPDDKEYTAYSEELSYPETLMPGQKKKWHISFELPDKEKPAKLILKHWEFPTGNTVLKWNINPEEIKNKNCVFKLECQQA